MCIIKTMSFHVGCVPVVCLFLSFIFRLHMVDLLVVEKFVHTKLTFDDLLTT